MPVAQGRAAVARIPAAGQAWGFAHVAASEIHVSPGQNFFKIGYHIICGILIEKHEL